jgi:simple sugar transport system permease protein
MALRVEKRFDVPRWMDWGLPLISFALALAVGALLLGLLGVSPLKAYGEMIRGSLGDGYGISETIVKAIPIALCGLAVALAFTMVVWNIGAEGQLVAGALAAAAAVRFVPLESPFLMIPLMALVAASAGGLWAAFAGWLKARWSVNEIITTLMMNYIAILGLEYFVYGPWRDPTSLGFPLTPTFHDAARLPQLFGTRVHCGLFLALLVAFLLRAALRWSRWGYEIRVIGQNPRAAAYAGMATSRHIVLTLFLSGAIAGLAGMGEVAGLQGRLQPGFSVGYGFTAIIVAWLARLNPFAILVVSFFMGALLVGGDTLQVVMRLPLSSVQVLQGLILFFVLAGEFFRNYKVCLRRRGDA